MANKKNHKKKKDSSVKAGPEDQSRTISENRKARHRFEILEKIECGVMLVGSEVKSLRDGNISLDEAYVRLKGGEIWLVGADIAEFRQANIWNHAPRRARKLLVHQRQIRKLAEKAQEKGFTLVPLRIYFNSRGLVKVLVGVCRGKKLHDKRATKRDADMKRDIARAMKARGAR
jgi:SsrA-binding protein